MDKKEGTKMIIENTSFQQVILSSSWILRDETNRLDASFYSRDIIEARILIEELKKKSIEIEQLEDEKVFWPGRFKRKYVSKKEGSPFLVPSEVFMFSPKAHKYITNFPENIRTDKNWILITRSGTIGRCTITNELLSTFTLSDDLIRIVHIDNELLGYIYAFLNTWIGQAFLTKTKYGATVKHIESHHVSSIPIPIIREIKEDINEKILRAHKLREEAQKLLLKVDEMICRELSLPIIDEENIEYFDDDKGKVVKSFIIKASELNLRLDASYNNPILTLVRKSLKNGEKKGNFKLVNLSKISSDIFTPPRFKRAYIKDKTRGIPLLQGSHIPWIKALDIKYLWKKMKNIEKYIIRKNWILITCSGTIGRVAIVRNYWDNWTATNHITRVVFTSEVDAGYLTSYLQSNYGQYQLETLSYGGVVEEIGEAGELFNELLIPIPLDDNIKKEISRMILEAYDKKDQANIIEDEVIKLLESKLEGLSGRFVINS